MKISKCDIKSAICNAGSIKLATFSCGYCQGLSRICIYLWQEERKKKKGGSERLVRYFPLIRLTIGDSRSARAQQKIKEGRGKGGIDRRNETNHRKNEQCHAPLPFIVTRYYVTWCSFYRKNHVCSHNTLRHKRYLWKTSRKWTERHSDRLFFPPSTNLNLVQEDIKRKTCVIPWNSEKRESETRILFLIVFSVRDVR